jgi:ABC-type phosphate transport system substrate-binding protein
MKFCLASSLLGLIATLSSSRNFSTSAQSVVSVHGSGTTNPSRCYWHIMDLLQQRTKIPIRFTYRAVGSSTGITEFIGDGTIGGPDNHFGSGDIPIPTDKFNALRTAGVDFVHLPVVLGAISFFHSLPTGEEKLNLNACVLAQIFKRDITDWTDDRVKKLNPNLVLPSPSPITVARRSRTLGSSSTKSITAYLNKACDTEWPIESVGAKINWVADTVEAEGSGQMTDLIRGTPGTIGYVESGHGHSENLQEIELRNADDTKFISSKEAKEKGGFLAAALSADIPDFADEDFGNVELLNGVGGLVNSHPSGILQKQENISHLFCSLSSHPRRLVPTRGQ